MLRSAMSMAEAPSEVWEALPAVMSGAIEGSHDAALGSWASDSTVLSGRMPWSRSNSSPVSAPSSSLIGTGTVSLAKWPLSQFSWARRWDSTA